jgi:uncharacterized protein YndB with AHSA1/START domain
MPIKKDGTGKRWVEMELLLPGTPEQVWQAMATGPGYAAWFVEGEIEPRIGGSLRFDFGEGATTSGEVTTWEPPNGFGYVERDWDKDAPPVATEITITSRAGDRCVVRMTHSLFTSSDDWDDQVEGFESGWPGFFAVLRVYLRHFAGEKAAGFIAQAKAKENSLTEWLRLGEILGLTGASVGERRTISAGAEAWSGIVEHVHQDEQQRYALLRVEVPSPGVALVGTHDTGKGVNVSVCRYYYGDDAAEQKARQEQPIRTWLSTAFEA